MVIRPVFRLVTALIAASLGTAASAKEMDAFDAQYADISILQLKPIQAELGVTEAQRTKLNAHAAWLNGQTSSIDSQVKSGKLKAEDANRQMEGILASFKSRILGELTAMQIKRLREITLQRDGLIPLLDKQVADKIGMTSAQLTKLRDAYLENDKKAKDIQTAAFKPIFDKYAAMKPKNDAEKKALSDQANKELEAAKSRIQPQLEELGRQFAQFVDAALSKGQHEAFESLKGRPFKVPAQTPPKTGSGG